MVWFFKGDTNGGMLSDQEPRFRITVDVPMPKVDAKFLEGLGAVIGHYIGSGTVTIKSIELPGPNSAVVSHADFKEFLKAIWPTRSEKQINPRARVLWVQLFANTPAMPWCLQCRRRQIFSKTWDGCGHMSKWVIEKSSLINLGDVDDLDFGYKKAEAFGRDTLRLFLRSLHDTPAA